MKHDTTPDTTLEPVAQSVSETPPELDHAKLLGFRNLTGVTNVDSDLVESSELAFNKRGTEGLAA